MGLGVGGPDDLRLVFEEGDGPFAVSKEKRDWITEDALRAPTCKLRNANPYEAVPIKTIAE